MIKQPEKLAKIATLAALLFLVGMGLIIVFFPIKPFWSDERCIIYNLKTHTSSALWGQLDFMQQFPRVYLQLLKCFTQYFDYSYFSLRFPSFVVGTITLVFTYRFMQKLYPAHTAIKFLFILILASSHTFVVYYAQIKQYTMDIFLSIVALWQLMQLLQLKEKNKMPIWRYGLLCLSFLIAPFFSYAYPIMVGPVFIIALLQSIFFAQLPLQRTRLSFVIRLWLPLMLCMVSLVGFYLTDVAQLMQDHGMKQFWESMMMQHGFDLSHFLYSFYLVFANVGNGLLFEVIFGITGMAAFFLAISHCLKNFRNSFQDTPAQFRLYSMLLIFMILFLFVAGKLPIGEPRLNAYSVPSIAILIIYFVNHFFTVPRFTKFATGLIVVLFLGTIGNIINSPIKSIASKDHHKKLAIYNNVTEAIGIAQTNHIPLFVTSAIGFPDVKVFVFPNTTVLATQLCYPPDYGSCLHFNSADEIPADWVLKTNPAYKMGLHLPVYAIDDINKAQAYIGKIPGNYTAAVAVNDTCYRIVKL